MTKQNKRNLYSACLILLGAGAANADPAPRSLHMRPGQRSQARVAQPDQPTPPADGTTPPTDGTPAPTPTPTPTPAPTKPNVPATPNLSDEELAKMAEADAAKKEGEVIVVTGSAIERKELTTPSPVSIIDREKLESAGIANVGDILQKLPSQGNALNAQNNNAGDGSTRVDLRSLGTARTLVLLNGRRMVAGGLGADASPDIGSIPLAIIERVEVLKDGASAIYGSDAISGVVNIITRQDFEGTEVSVYTGTSGHGDGTNYDLSVVTGHSSKKGNVMFAVGYTEQKPVFAGTRDFSKATFSYNFDPTTPAGSDPPFGGLTQGGSTSPPGGRITAKDSMGNPVNIPGCSNSATGGKCIANPDGTFRNFVGPDKNGLNDNYNFQPENYLFTPSQKVNLFSSGHYEIAKGVNIFYEASYNNRRSTQQIAAEPLTTELFGTTISADSMYNPFGADIPTYHRRLVEFGDRTFKQDISTYRTVVGVEGHIPEDMGLFSNWKWEVSFNAGRSTSQQQTGGDLIVSHLANALGPSMLVGGTPTCVSTPGDATTAIAGCVPLSLLKPGTVTQDMINYLAFTGIASGFNEQRSSIAQISGQLVKLPNGGDISVAAGGDYRHEQGGFLPDPLTATGDTTGNAQAPTEGSYHLFEGFGELSIVPVSGLEYAQWAEIDLAARAYDYSNFGSGATYKASALFRTAGGLSFRGTYGTAFRAPSVIELYQGKADSFPLIEDPCDTNPPSGPKTIDPNSNTGKECAREKAPANANFNTNQQRSQIGGNTKLQPETAKILTTGIVWEPLQGLGITLDYWNIEIDNQIAALPIQTILSQCYTQGNLDFCDPTRKGVGIVRTPLPDGSISYIFDPTANSGTLKTSGLDFAVGYTWKSPGVGRFRHALEGTKLFKYNFDTGSLDSDGKEHIIHGKGSYDLGVNPALKMNILTSWIHPSGFGAGFNIRYVGGFRECGQNNCQDPDPANSSRPIDAYFTGDLYLDYMVKSSQGTTRIAAGMNNVADKQPPAIYNGAALNADESAYDFMGRYFYVRLSQLF